jgi:hypothetical protein
MSLPFISSKEVEINFNNFFIGIAISRVPKI